MKKLLFITLTASLFTACSHTNLTKEELEEIRIRKFELRAGI